MITFGTSGWRGIIADDFTFDNVRIVTQAIADTIRAQNKKTGIPAVIIGYDTRFLSERFAELSAEVLCANGIPVKLCKRDTPTPVIAYEIIRQKLSGVINYTASHNPWNYNGIKFSPEWGGPALPETTKAIEKRCRELTAAQIKTMPLDAGRAKGLLDDADPRALYFKRMKELVDFSALKKANLKVVTDVLYGTGRGYLDELLDQAGVRQKVLHNNRDVLFGGNAPEPAESNLQEMKSIMKKESCTLGLATDGDADRFGIIDSDGTFINPNQTIALLLYHLVKTRNWKGLVARSVMTTHLIDRLAETLGLIVKETPVGFKYIGEIMVNNPKEFIIGGEESGGLTIRGHVPEKDGILACLLAAEMVAMSKKPLRKTLAEIAKLTGPIISTRVNFHLTTDAVARFKEILINKLPHDIGGMNVEKTITLDGYKFILPETAWLGMRFSGTEPVVRLYAEASSDVKLKKIVAAGKAFITAH